MTTPEEVDEAKKFACPVPNKKADMTRETGPKLRHRFIYCSRDTQYDEYRDRIETRVTYDRDTGELLASENVIGMRSRLLYRDLDKPRPLKVEFYFKKKSKLKVTPQEDEDEEAEGGSDPDLSNVEMLKDMMSLNEFYAALRNLCTCFTPQIPLLQVAHTNHDGPYEATYAYARQFKIPL